MATIDSWSSIEAIIRQRLDLIEMDRRYCVICGQQGPSLSRCFGCQMVYYCGEEHQMEDWSNEHGQKCAQLEWVALGEFIRALPAQPPLPELGDKWPVSLKEIETWMQWFSIRGDILHLAKNTANVFHNLVRSTDKRQPSFQNAVDGLLAAVTDLLTYVLTIGKAIISFGLQPHQNSLNIHIIHGFKKADLIGNEYSSSSLPSRFHELLNMFPDNKGVELIIVIDDDEDDDDQSSLPQANLRPDRLIITTRGKGYRLDTLGQKRLSQSNNDLLVCFNAAHLFLTSNREHLKLMLKKGRPLLLTFDDEDEFHLARNYLSNQNIPITQAGSNPFGSLMIQQRVDRPNSTYSTNSYQILIGRMSIDTSDERNDDRMSISSRRRIHQSSTNIQHSSVELQHQQQFNPGLKQVNGKIHIESLSSSSPLSHNAQANNNETLRDTNVHKVSIPATTSTVSTSNTTATTVQPAPVQRRRLASTTPSSHINILKSTDVSSSSERTTMNVIEPNRLNVKPQPKPRLSLVKASNHEQEVTKSNSANGLVQRIKPFFEQTSQETCTSKIIRQPQSIPQTYQSVTATKVTCLDDLISPRTNGKISTSPMIPLEKPINDRIATAVPVVSTIVPVKVQTDSTNKPSEPITNSISSSSSTSIIKPHSIKGNVHTSIATTTTVPIEIHHEQRSIISDSSIASPIPLLASESRHDEQKTNQNINKPNITTISLRTVDKTIDRPISPPTNTEIIYTEVKKHSERNIPLSQVDSIKAPLSPSRSFVIPTKSPSISSKNSSFNMQRTSRPLSTNNFSFQTPKHRPLPTSMTADRISLYSQRSTKQADVGITIKNISESIDHVGVVFDETHRPQETVPTALTTVDLIREQLNFSNSSKPTESLLDKLHKSNSNTRLSNGSSRKTITKTSPPRSKSEQATPLSKANPPPAPTNNHSLRRQPGLSLPITPKTVQENEIVPRFKTEPQATALYQNLDTPSSNIQMTKPQSNNYTLKQANGPLCNGIPRPFRKPTAIIEPSPVVPSTVKESSEPNYVNLGHDDGHIYTNENENLIVASSNSNSYTSKTSSIYSTSDKSTPAVQSEPLCTVEHSVPIQTNNVDYDSFDDDVAVDNPAHIDHAQNLHDNTDDDSFDDDDEGHHVITQVGQSSTNAVIPVKPTSAGFFRSTLNRLTRSNKSLDRVGLNNEPTPTESVPETMAVINVDTKTKKTLRSIKARHEAKKTGNLLVPYTGDDDTTSIDSNCSTQTATSLNKQSKSPSQRFRLFRRKVEKEFASDTEAEKHQTEQRRKKWSKKMIQENAEDLKAKRLLMISDDEDDDAVHVEQSDAHSHQYQQQQSRIQQDKQRKFLLNDETHIYDHIVHDETNSSLSRMGKLSHETHQKTPTITLDEIRSEIKAEIAARQEVNPNNGPLSTANNSSNLNLQKKRSKSVTFLDELLVDGPREKQANSIRKAEITNKPSTTARRIEKGDARSICGALTGTGPIRGIIKAANNEITGTTAPVSPSAAAAIYLSGAPIDNRCTSPKMNDRTHRPLSTYTVGSTRFYDGSFAATTMSNVQNGSISNNVSHSSNSVPNQRSLLTNGSTSGASTSADHTNPKRPTAKVSPFQTKSPTEMSSSPKSPNKLNTITSSLKKPIRPLTQKSTNPSNDSMTIPQTSISEVVGGVSRRLQSNF